MAAAGFWLLLMQPATAQEPPTTTTTTVAPVYDGPSSSDFHELEQELLTGGALLVFLTSAHVVGSWRR